MKILKLLEKNRYEIKLNKTGLYRFVEEGSKELVNMVLAIKLNIHKIYLLMRLS